MSARRQRCAAAAAAIGGFVLISTMVIGTLVGSLTLAALILARPASAVPAVPPVAAQPFTVPRLTVGRPHAYRVPISAFRWPVAPPIAVVRPFAPPPRPWLSGHRGVDLAAGPGARVVAAGAGVVAFAGQVAGTDVVSIDHAGGLRTTYQPVLPAVRVGQVLVAGDPIGVVNARHPGCPVAACVHWGLRTGATYLDPLSLLGTGRIRLLPLAGAA